MGTIAALAVTVSLPVVGQVRGSQRTGATIPETEVRVIHSEVAGRDFEIQVALPRQYEQTTDRYPVI